VDGVGVGEGWGSVAEPGESGGGEEEWEVGGTAADEGKGVMVGRPRSVSRLLLRS